MYVLSLPYLILLLLFITSCEEKKQVDEIRGIEYFLKGEKGYIANSFNSVVYNLDVSSEYINPTDILYGNLRLAQAKVVSAGTGVMNCSEGQIKICQNVIKPELEDRPLDSTLKAFVKPGSLVLIFENGFSDSAVVLINNKMVSRVLLRTSSSLGKCNEEVIIDYSHYKEVPRITVELINKGECMYFYPLRHRRAAYINHEIVNKWRILLSNDRHFYY